MIAAVLAVVIVGGVGLMWPQKAVDSGIKVWDASDGQQEPK
jgi:hypothetical protein